MNRLAADCKTSSSSASLSALSLPGGCSTSSGPGDTAPSGGRHSAARRPPCRSPMLWPHNILPHRHCAAGCAAPPALGSSSSKGNPRQWIGGGGRAGQAGVRREALGAGQSFGCCAAIGSPLQEAPREPRRERPKPQARGAVRPAIRGAERAPSPPISRAVASEPAGEMGTRRRGVGLRTGACRARCYSPMALITTHNAPMAGVAVPAARKPAGWKCGVRDAFLCTSCQLRSPPIAPNCQSG